jgi:hypothetical protein
VVEVDGPLEREAAEEARGGAWVVVRLAVGEQEHDGQGVDKWHLGELVREGAHDGEVAGVDGAAKVRADVSFARHRPSPHAPEHMFVA